MQPPKPPVPFASVNPSPSPRRQLSDLIERRLQEQSPDALAYIMMTETGIEVHLTIAHAALASIVEATPREVQRTLTSAGSLPSVRVIPDATHSWRTLEAAQKQITARADELAGQGIKLREWGVNPYKNRTSIGVKDLTPAQKQYLEHEFGADKVDIFESAGWHGWQPVSRSQDKSSP